MYPNPWGLCESPFRVSLDARFFFQSPIHEEALARLHFLVEQRRRLGVLLGPAGSGKSLVLECFAAQLRRQGAAVARTDLDGVDLEDMLAAVGVGWELNPDGGARSHVLWRLVEDRIKQFRYEQRATVLLVDDAHCGEKATTAALMRLAESDLSPDSRLTIVLGARSESIALLDPRFLELAELRIDLEPWDQSDTAAYLAASLAAVGRGEPLFDGAAATRLHELAGGVPRRVSLLADLALLAAAGENRETIDAHIVESAYRGLGLVEV